MITPELSFGDKEQRLASALAGKDPFLVFMDGEGRGFDGPSAWRTFAYPDKFALHKWSTDEGETVELLGTRIIDGDVRGALLPEFFVLGEGQPATHGISAKPEMKYRGLVERDEALDIALAWLDTHGSEEKAQDEELDDLAGVLTGPNGPVVVTGIGAVIFGNHIRAMQKQGVAEYHPLSSESDN